MNPIYVHLRNTLLKICQINLKFGIISEVLGNDRGDGVQEPHM